MVIAPKQANEIERLRKLAHTMDTSFTLPGTSFRFGWDAIIGLVPGVGDLGGAVISAYIVHRARRMGVGRAAVLRMTINVLADLFVGAVPLAGDAFDASFKANRRNVLLLERALDRDA